MPGCEALIEQVPALTSVTSAPALVQTAVVVDTKLTGSDELALAVIGKGEIPRIWLDIASKVIVCEAALTVKLCDTGVAAA